MLKSIAGHSNYVPPDRSLRKRPPPAKVIKLISAFDYHTGTIELYMDDELVKVSGYYDKARRKRILAEWEIWMRNFYGKKVFYIHIKPNER